MFSRFDTDSRQLDAASLWEELTGRTREEAVETMDKSAGAKRLYRIARSVQRKGMMADLPGGGILTDMTRKPGLERAFDRANNAVFSRMSRHKGGLEAYLRRAGVKMTPPEDQTAATAMEAMRQVARGGGPTKAASAVPRLHEKQAMSRAEMIGAGVGAAGLGTAMGLSGYARHKARKGGRSRAEVDSAMDMLRYTLHRKNERDAGPPSPEEIKKFRTLSAKFKADSEAKKNPGRAAAVYAGVGAIGGGVIGHRVASRLSKYGPLAGRYAQRLSGK
jgi:hypothetical protein